MVFITFMCPQAFKRYLQQHFTGAGGREAHFELLNGTWNWKDYLKGLDIELHGLTPTQLEPGSNHCWRFVAAADIHAYGLHTGSAVQNPFGEQGLST